MTEYDTLYGKPVTKRIYHTQRCCYVEVVAVDVGRAAHVAEADSNQAMHLTAEDRTLFRPPRKARKTARILAKIDNYLRTQPDNEAWLGDIAAMLGMTKRGARHHIRDNPDRYIAENRIIDGRRMMIIVLRGG